MIKNYIIKETLGKGAYGIVYKVQKKGTSDIYVIKQISLEGLTEKEKEEVKQEAFILSSIKSDFVVKYYDSFLDNDNINIVMEYCDGGDLNDFILEKKNIGTFLEEKLIWNLFLKIAIGLADIHKMKILHRDLKTLNIFLKHGLDVKIGDLGVAKVLSKNSFANTVIGTPYYLSPEICQEKPYNDKSDVWALGCILYELCTFKHPFEAKHQGGLILKILNNKPEPINSYYSKELSNLIFMLLDKNSKSRPSCVEILNNNMVMNKLKEFGLFDYLKKINRSRNNSNKDKASRKTIDFNSINISKKYYSKQNSKDNIHSDNIIKFEIKNKGKHYSPIDLSNNIKNGNIKFKNIIHKKKSPEEIKINLIKIVNINNQKQNYINKNNHNKNNNDFKYNNYFVNKTENDENNEKSLISKKYAKIYKQDRADLINKKKSSQVQIIFKSSNEPAKPNNIIESKKKFILNNNKSNEIIIQNSKYENNKNDNKSNKYKYKFIKKENNHKNIVPIKIKKISDNHKEIDDDISIAKSDIFSNSFKKKIINKKVSTPEINRKKIINLVFSNKKIIPSLNKISLLSRKDDSYSIEVGLFNNKKNENFSIPSSLEKNILNEKTITSSFQMFNNNLPKINKRNNNDNKLITNECEYLGDDTIRKNKRCKSYLNPRINNDKNIIEHSNHHFKGEEKNIKYLIERKNINPKNSIFKKSEKFNSYLPLVSKDYQLEEKI